eukprot:6687385-Prymnesium_polylepis.1
MGRELGRSELRKLTLHDAQRAIWSVVRGLTVPAEYRTVGVCYFLHSRRAPRAGPLGAHVQ